MIAVIKAHSDSFGGVTLAVDAWKNIKINGLLMKSDDNEEIEEDENENENEKEKDKGEEDEDESDSGVVDIPSDDNEESVQSDEEEVTVINDEVVFDSNISLIDLKFDWKSLK